MKISKHTKKQVRLFHRTLLIHLFLGGKKCDFEGDYKAKWLVMVVIFCSVWVIKNSRPQEQETTTTTFSFFKKGTRRLNH